MKKILKIVVLSLLFVGTIFVLVAANKKINNRVLNLPTIHLEVQKGVALITEMEILNELRKADLFKDNMLKQDLEVDKVEAFLRNINEIESADVYLELGSDWDINVKTKLPIARVVVDGINDFYIDSENHLMQLSPYSKPLVLAFTGLGEKISRAGGYNTLINNDSLKTILKLNQIYLISNYVCNDVFYHAQVVQVQYIDSEGFVAVPRVGTQQIILGEITSREDVKKKFNKLAIFYKEVIPYMGWEQYETINLKFDNQIVAKKRN